LPRANLFRHHDRGDIAQDVGPEDHRRYPSLFPADIPAQPPARVLFLEFARERER
jgi:hypothetical protein